MMCATLLDPNQPNHYFSASPVRAREHQIRAHEKGILGVLRRGSYPTRVTVYPYDGHIRGTNPVVRHVMSLVYTLKQMRANQHVPKHATTRPLHGYYFYHMSATPHTCRPGLPCTPGFSEFGSRRLCCCCASLWRCRPPLCGPRIRRSTSCGSCQRVALAPCNSLPLHRICRWRLARCTMSNEPLWDAFKRNMRVSRCRT